MRSHCLPSIGILLLILHLAVLTLPATANARDSLLPLSAGAAEGGTIVLRLELATPLPDSAPPAVGSLIELPPGAEGLNVAALEAEVAGGVIALSPALVHVGEVMGLRGVTVAPVSVDPAALARAAGAPVAAARIVLTAPVPPDSRGGLPMAARPADLGRGVYLVITADAFADAIQPLVEWKTQAGFDVRVHRTSEIGASVEAIRAFVREAYQTWEAPPRYLLLVGDVESIPTTLVSGNVSDHTYACVDGDDFLPDLLVGRFSAKTPADVAVQVAKTLHYERTPETAGGDWFSRALMAAGNLNSSTPVPLSRWARDELLASGFTAADSAYKSNSPQHPWWDGRIIIKYFVDRGVSLVNYRGWAYGDEGWQPPNFWNQDVPSLANGWKLPVVFSIVCHTGNFGNVTIDCFGEAWMKAGTPEAPLGAVAFVGTGEHWSHSRWNDRIDMGVIQAIADAGLREVGAILASAKLSIVPLFPTEVRMSDVSDPEQSVEYYSYIYNLLGDPSLELRTAMPRTIHVSVPRSIGFGSDAVEIGVTESDGATPIAGARVALSQNGQRIGYGLTDAAGAALVPVAPGTTDPITVTVTGRDLYPWQETVLEVVQHEVSLTASTAEPVSGQHALPGAAVDVTLTVRNTGTQTVSGATVSVSAPSGVTVVTGTASLGTIAGGGTGATLTPLRLQLSPDFEDGTRLALRVTPTVPGAGELPPTGAELVVEAPALRCTGTSGGDGIFDPGETSELVTTLLNDGAIGAGLLGAELRVRVPGQLTLVDSTATLAEILPGASGGNGSDPFRITLPDTLAVGTVIPLALDITHADGPHTLVEFSLTVGDVDASAPAGPDAYGYYAYDSADIDYTEQAPVYRWVECSPAFGGAGSALPITDNARGVMLPLPFTFRYYGFDFDTLRVNDNGWVSFDLTWWYDIRNWSFPDTWGGGSQIAPFWDNLDPSIAGSDGIYAWYDAAQHRQVIEWSRLHNWETGSESSGCDDFQTFELILCDPAYYPTPTGDGEIIFQYKQIVNDDWARMYSTVGMEDPTETIGLVYTYGNQYAPGAAPLSPGLAIRITTVPPVYHPVVQAPTLDRPMVHVVGGSVTTGETRLLLDAGRRSVKELAVYDAAGRQVRDLAGGLASEEGPRTLYWDGRDAAGRRVPSGLYWVRLRAGDAAPRVRVLVLR